MLELPLFLSDMNPTVANLLVALIVLAVVVLVGRFVLNLAWRLLKIAALVIGLLWILSVVFEISVPLF